MNIKTLKNKIKSLIDSISISHTFVTVDGNRINCTESINLYDDENEIIIAKCRVNFKTKLITINSNKIEYVIENFDQTVWDQLYNITTVNTKMTSSENEEMYR